MEANYGATELEALGVVWSLRHFRAYLLGHKCIVYTDHAPLKSSLTTKHTSGRRAHWNEMMADYDMEIRYKPGTKNANANAVVDLGIYKGGFQFRMWTYTLT